ncbi:hypothetical protein [Lysobacter niastensis]|uniref:DUF4410 domain-containing protein n=1 Tax=Lysobacter niastensis TaxID=380629 RepID=A0ABS0B856_9GAMM|nr:hypothetical protein [Lysobacter niastensis]MBF6023839.1 hypothetical protein [Lysobacter niastensis]
MSIRSMLATAGLLLLLASPIAMAKDEIRASSETNQAPSETFNAFDRFELAPLEVSPEYASHEANQRAKGILQGHLLSGLGVWANDRNLQTAKHDPVRTLRIEPKIEKIRFVTGAGRIWGGAFAGSSQVLLTLRIVDKASGQVLAQPEFYQHARGMAAAWTGGGADYAMLERVANLANQYIGGNYETATGGKTGWAP